MPNPILQRVYLHSEALPLAETRWAFLESSPSVRRYPGDARDLIAGLSEEFNVDDIVAAGIAVRDDAGELEPSPSFGMDRPEFLFVRQSTSVDPYDLVSTRGSLVSEDPPCFNANRDWHTSAHLAKQDELFIVGRLCEVALLRQLGYAASLLTGLGAMDGGQLRRFCGRPDCEDQFRDYRPDRMAPIRRRRKTSIIFVGFDLLHLRAGVPDETHSVATKLLDFAAAFGFDSGFLKIWTPTDDELLEIVLATEIGDIALVRDALRSSRRSSMQELYSYVEELARPADLHGAEQALSEEVRMSRQRNYATRGLPGALKHFNSIFDETVLGPIRDEVEGTTDSVERPLLLRSIELTVELHQTSPVLRLAAIAGTRSDFGDVDPLTPAEHESRRRCSAQLADVFRKLRQKRWT